MLTLLTACVILNVKTLLKVKKINEKTKSFLSGKNGKDLEGLILDHVKSIESMDNDIQELFKASNKLYSLAQKGLNKIGLIRFNPFKDLGGDQSFALALLNGKNNGVVISSLHTREGTRIYSKSIKNGKSEKHTLTTEEQEAIKKAIESGKMIKTK